MYENVVDILIYLYENYMDSEGTTPPDENELREELSQAGFPRGKIEQAFEWLDDLANRKGTQELCAHKELSIRIHTREEMERLDQEARGLLLFLEQSDILRQDSRELVIERALALDTAIISVEELKWIVLMVLINQPGQEAAFARMEDMVFNLAPDYLH
jgi:Smg protein